MKEKKARCLRVISVGKYQTTLYNKTGLPYMSSVLGGLITLVCVLIIATYSVFLLISIFQKERYNLDMATQEIRAYQLDYDKRLQKNLTSCETGNCRDILVSDWENVCNDIEIHIDALKKTTVNVSVYALMKGFDGNSQKIVSRNYSEAVFALSEFDLTSNLSKEQSEELLFYHDPDFGMILSRISFLFEFPIINGERAYVDLV
jgi:hypothetical protein